MIPNYFETVFAVVILIVANQIKLGHNQNFNGGRRWTNTNSNQNNYRVQMQSQVKSNYKNSFRYQYKYQNHFQRSPGVSNQFNYATNRNQDYVIAGLRWINRFRNIHRVQSLSLDQDLVQRAQKCAFYYASRGVIDHSCGQKNGAGENLFMYRSSYSFSGTTDATIQAISSWYREQKFYKNLYNRDPNGFNSAYGHFTAMVWKTSQKLGLGVASVGSRTVVVSLFYPPGNHLRRFKENVLPPAF